MPAASERSRSVRRIPFASSTSPLRKSMPAVRICRPGRAASVIVMPLSVSHGVFLDDDGVGAFGDHAAGKDPDRLARAKRLVERAAGRDLADHLEPRPGGRCIGGAHRIAVHRRHRLRRLGAQRRDVARQHAVIGRVQRDHFLGQRLGARENRGTAPRQPASMPRGLSSIRRPGLATGSCEPSNGERARRQKAARKA